MSTPARALAQFVHEVTAINESGGHDTEFEYTDVDGFDRYRSVVFDEATDEWLEPVLAAVSDPRLASVEQDEHVKVTVVADSRADTRDPFGLGQAFDVLFAPKDEPETETEPAPKKRAPRKRA